MEIVMEKGVDDIATVHAAVYRDDKDLILEFVDSLSGSSSIDEKWVLVVSSQFGCPINCLMCDTTGYYKGNPDPEELFSQVEHMVKKRFPDGVVPAKKFKVQFARMGEPALNPSVISAIKMIDERIDAPGFMPCISTTAPEGAEEFFEELISLNHGIFKGRFQLQFSIHSTDDRQRNRIIPVDKWNLEKISDYGRRFFVGGRKISLNFALALDNEMDVERICHLFPPEIFMLKLTPVNPTDQARNNDLVREKINEEQVPQIEELRSRGYDVILSIGDIRENEIGSNCGQLAAIWKGTN